MSNSAQDGEETISSNGTRTSDRKSDKRPSTFYRARRNVARNGLRFLGLVVAGVWIYLSVSWYNQVDRISGELSKSELEINSLWEQLAVLDERDIARRQDLSTYSHSKARRTVNEKEGIVDGIQVGQSRAEVERQFISIQSKFLHEYKYERKAKPKPSVVARGSGETKKNEALSGTPSVKYNSVSREKWDSIFDDSFARDDKGILLRLASLDDVLARLAKLEGLLYFHQPSVLKFPVNQRLEYDVAPFKHMMDLGAQYDVRFYRRGLMLRAIRSQVAINTEAWTRGPASTGPNRAVSLDVWKSTLDEWKSGRAAFGPGMGEIGFSGDDVLLKDVQLNDVLQLLANFVGLNYYHNAEINVPQFLVSGRLDVDVDPMRQMWDRANQSETTIHIKGKTLYCMTAGQIAQLPGDWKSRPNSVKPDKKPTSLNSKKKATVSYSDLVDRGLLDLPKGISREPPDSTDPEPGDGLFIRGATLNDVYELLANSADLTYSRNEELEDPKYVVTGRLQDGDPIEQMEELGLMYGLNLNRMGSTMYAKTDQQLLMRDYQPTTYEIDSELKISRLAEFAQPGETMLRSQNEENGSVYLFDLEGRLRMIEVGNNEKVATIEGLTVGAPFSVATHFYGEARQWARLPSKEGDYVTYSFPSFEYTDGKGRVYELILVRLDKTGMIERILVGYRDEG